MTKLNRTQAVTGVLSLELGYAGQLGAAGLTEAIVEALENGRVLEEAGIVYIKAQAPGERFMEVNVWAAEAEESEEPEPPTIPEGPEPNA